MNMTVFNPFRNLSSVDSFFDNYFSAPQSHENATLRPRVDVFEENDKLVLEAELPGVNKESITVSVERNVLTLSAEKKHERELKEGSNYLGERAWGKYERSFKLADTVDQENIEASYHDGVLRLEIAQKPEAVAKRIEIQ
ncbi:MAG: Hsp20/alpha crystallin family protein [Fibrobacter sp.]|nr:Hsp20/alpha crystallin family protein [Fibrobacter sp.]